MWNGLPLYFFEYCHILGISLNNIKGRPCETVKNLSPDTELWYVLIFNNENIYGNPYVDKIFADSKKRPTFALAIENNSGCLMHK